MSAQRRSATKRRSSGRRSGRSGSPATLRAEARQSPVAVAEPVVAPPAPDKPKRRLMVNKATAATGPSKSPATTPAAASNVRTAARRGRTAPEPAKRRTFVNTDRFEGLQRFIRETMAEIRKVIWPDRETTRNLTLVVIAVSIVLGIMLGGIDYVLFQLFEALP